jgi:deoxyribonuclease IV
VPPAPIGAHVRVAGGLLAGLREASGAGAEAVQVFASNPRGWALTPGDPVQEAAFAEMTADMPVFVHASYLVNLASPDELTAQRSAESLRHSLRRGARIGARGVVVHAGSATVSPASSADIAAALKQVRENLMPLLDEVAGQGPDVLLEPMAGQGGGLVATVDGFAAYLDALDWHPRACVCLDTCHAYAAGHDLAAPSGVGRMLAALQNAAGPGRLKLVHANDSKDPCGSRRDRHENIGAGHIGPEPFRELLRHPRTAGIPFIVETPGRLAGHKRDIALLKKLARVPGGRMS